MVVVMYIDNMEAHDTNDIEARTNSPTSDIFQISCRDNEMKSASLGEDPQRDYTTNNLWIPFLQIYNNSLTSLGNTIMCN